MDDGTRPISIVALDPPVRSCMSTISVITPTLNAGEYIADCLSAVADCSSVLEHIVVDGGSLDATKACVLAAGARFELLAGSSIYAAMNHGARMATGDVLLFANADDVLLGDGVDAALHQLRCSSCLWLVGAIRMTDARLEPIRMYRPPRRLGPFLTAAFGYLPYPHPATLVYRSFFWELDGFDERYRYAADYDFAIRALESARPCVSEVTVANFRMHASNASRSEEAAQDAKRVSRRYVPRAALPVMTPLARALKRL